MKRSAWFGSAWFGEVAPFFAQALRRRRALTFERGLGRGELRDRDAERAATDIIEPEPVAELHARWFTAVLATDPELDLGPRLAAAVARHLHQLPHALLV